MAGLLRGLTLGLACLIAGIVLCLVSVQLVHGRLREILRQRDERIGRDIMAVLDGASTWDEAAAWWTRWGDRATARRIAVRLAGTVKGGWLTALQEGYREMGGLEADRRSLNSRSLARRLRALDHLEVMADAREISALQKALGDRVSLVRARAAKLLLQLRAPIECTVAAMLAHGGWRTGSGWLGQALAEAGGTGAERALWDMLAEPSLDVGAQERLLEVLVDRRAPGARELALTWRGDARAPWRAAAVRLLARFEHPDDVGWVQAKLDDRDAEVRWAALEAMDHHGIPLDPAQLVRLLADPDARIRGYAAGLWARRSLAGDHP